MQIVLISLFNGASIAQLASEKVGLDVVKVYTSEVDKYALLHEKHHYPTNKQLGDVSKIDFFLLKKEMLIIDNLGAA
jgi:site-specific DNA-cytosine methylase